MDSRIISYKPNPYSIPKRKGDPLQLGIRRKSPPPDPEKYDDDIQKNHFSTSLLTPEEIKERDEELKKSGYISIETVRELFKSNLSKESSTPDAEFMIQIDSRIDYKIFIVDNTIYTREELFENYAFSELGQEPEDFFSRQLIGVFDNEFITKDEDDESMEFIKISDMFKMRRYEQFTRLKKDTYPDGSPVVEIIPEKPKKIVPTKIYIGKSSWDDFLVIQTQFKTMIKMQMKAQKSEEPNIFNMGIFSLNFDKLLALKPSEN